MWNISQPKYIAEETADGNRGESRFLMIVLEENEIDF